MTLLDRVGQLVDLVTAVHDRGWRLRLIDLETAGRSGRRALPVGTIGYLLRS